MGGVEVPENATAGTITIAAPPVAWTGDVRHLGRFASARLGSMRDVWIYLPPSYAGSSARYPVVYFHDGQNVFDAATAFAGVEWQADEALEALARSGTALEAIAVAIANTPQRIDEYTPVTDARHRGGGRAHAYLDFLVRELKPHIDAQFRTLAAPRHTAIVGSSLGGLVSLFAGIAAPDAFGLVGALSPAFDWGAYDIEYRYRSAAAGGGPGHRLPSRLWIDMGTRESADAGGAARAVADLNRFATLLRACGYADATNMHCETVADARHDEAAWAARLPRVLRFLLAAPV